MKEIYIFLCNQNWSQELYLEYHRVRIFLSDIILLLSDIVVVNYTWYLLYRPVWLLIISASNNLTMYILYIEFLLLKCMRVVNIWVNFFQNWKNIIVKSKMNLLILISVYWLNVFLWNRNKIYHFYLYEPFLFWVFFPNNCVTKTGYNVSFWLFTRLTRYYCQLARLSTVWPNPLLPFLKLVTIQNIQSEVNNSHLVYIYCNICCPFSVIAHLISLSLLYFFALSRCLYIFD